MDLSFEDENNFNLPDPTGRLDFTEDEETNRKADNQIDENISMNNLKEDDQMNEEDRNESIDDDIESADFDQKPTIVDEPEFTKPIINQNLLLNRIQSKNVFNQNGLQEPVTPALIKRKQFKPWFNSPTDNCLSPCTQKIFKSKKPI